MSEQPARQRELAPRRLCTETGTAAAKWGLKLVYQHQPGAANRVPLVMCNGIGSGMASFDTLIRELDPERPVIRFDAPGAGRSTSPLLPYGYHQLACAVREMLRGLGYHEQVDVLGISWGGGLAQQFAFQYPRFCRRVVLAATATGVCMVPARPRVLSCMLTPRRHRDPGYALRVAGRLYGGSARHDPAATVQALHPIARASCGRGYLYQLAAIAGWSSLVWLPMIRQPTLVLAGDDDPIIRPINASIMSRLLPDGRLHRYRGGHLVLFTEPERLAPLIESFLDDSPVPIDVEQDRGAAS